MILKSLGMLTSVMYELEHVLYQKLALANFTSFETVSTITEKIEQNA